MTRYSDSFFSPVSLKNFVRALRLPFIAASLFPYIAGSFFFKNEWSSGLFFFGFVAVASTHLSGNLINDYSDSKSGVDWEDRTFYGFFGGSKLIQEGVFNEKFYLFSALAFSFLAAFSVLVTAVCLGSIRVLIYFLFILILAFSYSHAPFRLSYNYLGEAVIFLLFGPACVMGGYFLQTEVFPDLRSFSLSLPFGFFTTAILFVNEVPDYPDDRKAMKKTWVSILGHEQSYWVYCFLVAMGYGAVILNVAIGNLGWMSLLTVFSVFMPYKAAWILMLYYQNKKKLIESSKLTIGLHHLVSLIIIGDIMI
ncbi:MAG: prenyltransferase [Candidatus Aureabacteria bacterium]|nr:prenyltransferase [Candidatus Auribacterota bacterium]